jgi:hypothetical protein
MKRPPAGSLRRDRGDDKVVGVVVLRNAIWKFCPVFVDIVQDKEHAYMRPISRTCIDS